MARLPNTIRWRDFSGANVQKVSPDISIPNAVPFSLNLIFDKVLGEAVSREGISLLSTPSANNPCTGLFQHIDSTFANSKMFAGFNGSIYDAVTGNSSLGSLNASAKMRFATFLNATLMLNGLQSKSYTAAGGWISTAGAFDLANIPASGQFPIEFKDRIYMATTDRLYYTTTPSASICSWTTAGSGSLQVEQEDGGGTMQGLSKVPGYLMIYKQRSLKRWNFDSTFPEDLINIGTQSNESIIRARGKNYFFYGPHGFYETQGSYPQLISRPIQRIVESIPSSFYANVNGWSDNDHIYWSVGDITVDFDRGYTESYANVVLKYHIDTQQWAPFSYPHEFRFMHQYIQSDSSVTIIGGDTGGNVLQINSGNTDNGTAIRYILQSPEMAFGAREFYKMISEKVYVHSDRTEGAQLQVRLDYGIWQSIGSLKDIVTEVQIQPLKARIYEWRLVDSITGEQVKLRGIDFPNVNVLDN